MFFILGEICKYLDQKVKILYLNRFGLKKENNINKIENEKVDKLLQVLFSIHFNPLRPHLIKDMLKLGLKLEKYNLLLGELERRQKEQEDKYVPKFPFEHYEAMYKIRLEKESLINEYNKLKKK